MNKETMKPLKELDLLDRFLFAAAMEDKTVYQNLLEILLGEEIQKRVNQIKSSEEMGVRYMQAWEEREEAMEEGRREATKLGIQTMIESLRECQISDDIILEKLKEKYGLSEQEAVEYLRRENKE